MAAIITPLEGEKTIFTLRKNFLRKKKQALLIALSLIVSIGLLVYFQNEIVITVAVVLLAATIFYTFYHFLVWFYDVYIVTNYRVISINQKSLFHREYAEIDLDQVQDITYTVKGVFATIMHFGTVQIIGNGKVLELVDMSDPDELQETIKKLAEKSRIRN